MIPPTLSDSERQATIDHEHLKLLRIFHFVLGGMRIAFSTLFIFHAVLFAVFGSGVIPFDQPGSAQAGEPPPLWIFKIMAAVFGFFVLLGWTSGILTIFSGFKIGRRKARTYSLVVAALNCLSMPFGTVLGIFTIIVLCRESVRRLYTGESVPPPLAAGSGS